MPDSGTTFKPWPTDEIPSKLKHQLADMGLEKPSLPEDDANFKNMLQYTVNLLMPTMPWTVSFPTLIGQTLCQEVSRQESEVDRYEKELLKDVFENQNLDLARQYHENHHQRTRGIQTWLKMSVTQSWS